MTRIATTRLFADAAGFADLQATRLLELNRQLATGKRVEKPSDDPAASARVRALRAEIADLEQFGRNQEAASRLLRQAEAAIATFSDRVQRLRLIAVQAGSDILTTGDTRALGAEVAEILEDIIGIANTASEDRFLFAGSDVRTTPFVPVRDALGRITEVRYRGDLVELETAIERGAVIPTTFPGARAFGAGGQVLRSTTDVWNGATTAAYADREIAASIAPSSGVTEGSFVLNGVRVLYDIDGDPTSGEGDSLLDIARAVNEAPAGVAASVTGRMVGLTAVADPTATLASVFGAGVAGNLVINGETLAVTASDTLATLRDKINALEPMTDVTAEILDASGNVVDEVFNPAAGPFSLRLVGGVEIDDTAAGSSTVFRTGGVGLGFTNGAASPGNLVGTVTESYRLRLESRSPGPISMRDSEGSLLRDLGFITGNTPDLDNFVAGAVVETGTIFSATVEFITALQNGDTAEVRDRILGLLDRGLDALESARTEVGVRENRIERAAERADKFKENALDVASRLEEADLAQVIADLRQQQTVQEAALRATAQVLGNSLLNFL